MQEKELEGDKRIFLRMFMEAASLIGLPFALNLLAQYVSPITMCSEAFVAGLLGAGIGFLLERPGKKGRSFFQKARIALMGTASIILGGMNAFAQSQPPMPAGIELQKSVRVAELGVIGTAVVLLWISHMFPQDDN